MYNIKTLRSKPTVSGNLVHAILNYKLVRPVSILRLPKETYPADYRKIAAVDSNKQDWD